MDKRNKITLLLIWLFLLACNILLPFVSDDFSYAWDSRIGFQSVVNSYVGHNARFFNLLAYLYVDTMPALLFDILNSLVGVGFVLAFFALITGHLPKGRKDSLTVCVIFAMFVSLNAFGSIFIWLIGAANYLHGFLALALCLLPFRRFWGEKLLGEKYDSYCPWLVLLALVAGWSFEQVGIVLILAFCFFFVVAAVKKIRLPLWYWTGVALFVLGYCLLYFAPGESVRGDESDSYVDVVTFLSSGLGFMIDRLVKGFQQYHSKQYMFYYIVMIAYLLYKSDRLPKFWMKALCTLALACLFVLLEKMCLCIVCSVVMLAVLFYKLFSAKESRDRRLWCLLAGFFTLYCISAACAALVPFPMRAKFGGDIYLILSLAVAFRNEFDALGPKAKNVLDRGICAYLAVAACFIVFSYAEGRVKWENALSEAQASAARGDREIVMSRDVFISRYPFYGEWNVPGKDPSVWPNVSYSAYYGWDSLVVE